MLKLTHYTQSDGLTNNYVNCVLQDHLNFIWFGTIDGLNRFDGVEFDVYRRKVRDSLSLSSNVIHALAEDSVDRVWIGTANGLCWVDLNTQVVHRYDNPIVRGMTIFSLLLLNENTLLAGSLDHLYRISLQNMSCTSYRLSDKPKPPNHPRASSILAWNDSTVMTSGWDGIFKVDLNEKTSDHLLKTTATLISIEKYRDSLIWVSTWGAGAFVFDPVSVLTQQEVHFGYPWENHAEYPIICDMTEIDLPSGLPGLLLSGAHGIMLADPHTLQCKMIYNFHTGRQKSKVLDAFTKGALHTQNGDVWVIADVGVARIDSRAQRLEEYILEKQNTAPMHIAAIHRDKIDADSVWLALYAGGMALFDLNAQKIVRQCRPLLSREDQFAEYLIDCIKDDRQGFIVRNVKGDLYYFDRLKGSFETMNPGKRADAGRAGKFRRMHLFDGRLWTQMDSSLHLMDVRGQDIKSFSFDAAMCSWLDRHRIQGILLDTAGYCWIIGVYGGCRLFHPGLNRFIEVPIFDSEEHEVKALEGLQLFQDSGNQVWLSHSAGLALYDFLNNRFHPVLDDLPSIMSGVYLDNDDVFWIISGNQLVTYNPASQSVQRYTEADGLPEQDAITIGGVPGTDQIYIGYDGKFVLFEKSALKPRQNIEPIRLTGFQVLENHHNLLPEHDRHVSLRYWENDVRFDFRYLDFSDNKSTTYSFALEGSEDTWNEAGNSNFAIYTNLREGDYKFWVRATNSSGVTSAPALLAEFTIATPFWRSWWFRLLSIAAVAGVLGLLYAYRMNQLKSVMRMRTKISSDLHDELGGGLTSIRVYSEMARRQKDPEKATRALDKIEETAGEMVQSISDIVWTINPKYDNFTYLLQRMENFASSYLGLHEIQYHISKEKGIDSVKLSMQMRKNLLLIFKEAISHAAKRPECKTIIIRFDLLAGKLVMTISDDGLGFELQSHSLQNGLQHMDQQVKEIGGTIDLRSSNGRGTQIEVQIPLTPIH